MTFMLARVASERNDGSAVHAGLYTLGEMDSLSFMAGPAFGNDRNSFIWLPAYDGAKYRLYKSTWEFKILHAERAHLAQNFELIKETLRTPEFVRLSEKDPDCFLAYRQFDQYILGEGRQGSVVFDTYLAVVVDRSKGRIATFYPCEKPKPGKTLWPPRTQK